MRSSSDWLSIVRVPSRNALSYDVASQVRRPSAVFKSTRKLANVAGLTFSMQNDENFQGSAASS